MDASLKPCHALITGGAGFIGSHLTQHLLDHGSRVCIIDNFSTGRRDNLASCEGSNLTVIDADLSSGLQDLQGESFDAVYHLAASVGVRLVIDRPIETIRNNVLETLAVLEFAARTGIPTLVASSSEIYGKSENIPFGEDDDVCYGPTIFSRWSYAGSKAIDEYLSLAYSRERSLPVVITRFFNVVGPRQIGDYGMVLPRFVQAALKGEPLQVYGDGQQTRCFCDVRDMVTVLTQLIQLEGAWGRVVNVGSDQPICIEDLARLVCDTLASSSTIEKVPYDAAFGEGFDDLRHRVPDLTRLRNLTGFKPRIALTQTIKDLAVALRDTEAISLERSSA